MGQQADLVRQDILDRVNARKLLPGDRIDETDLRSRLDLSGTPIREALISLEAAGVIERRPRGGARILSLDLEGLMKSVEVLAETEAAVAYRAARRINPAQAKALAAAAKQCDAYFKKPKTFEVEYYDLNIAFHRALINAAGNEYLSEAVFHTSNRLIAYLACRHDLPGEAERSAKDHALICAAVLDSNGSLARDLMLEHVSFNDTLALDILNILSHQRS